MEGKKRELKKELKKLKKGKIDRETYVERRKEYRKWCDRERKRHEKEEEETIKAIRTEEEAWKYINKYRKRREGIDESIEIDKWFEYFMNLLDGSEERMVRTEEENREK